MTIDDAFYHLSFQDALNLYANFACFSVGRNAYSLHYFNLKGAFGLIARRNYYTNLFLGKIEVALKQQPPLM